MKFKIDENLPGELVADLREFGHDADTVFDEKLGGSQGPDPYGSDFRRGTDLASLDKGIANLKRYPVERHAGVVLFRPARSGRRVVLAFIRERLRDLLELDLRGRLTVVGPARIRVR